MRNDNKLRIWSRKPTVSTNNVRLMMKSVIHASNMQGKV